MDYRKGSIGRVFAVRIDHGEDVLGELSGLARQRGYKVCLFYDAGGNGKSRPRYRAKRQGCSTNNCVVKIRRCHEKSLGAGNIFWENGAPKIHLHGAAGSSKGMTMGCIRKAAAGIHGAGGIYC